MTRRGDTASLNCKSCCGVLPRSKDGLYGEDDEIICLDCCAVNIGFDDDLVCAYVSRYRCRHGKDSQEACDLCEVEEDGTSEAGGHAVNLQRALPADGDAVVDASYRSPLDFKLND